MPPTSECHKPDIGSVHDTPVVWIGGTQSVGYTEPVIHVEFLYSLTHSVHVPSPDFPITVRPGITARLHQGLETAKQVEVLVGKHRADMIAATRSL